ncbi:DUF1120 domain-containing protein [Achromobacter spanius]|uniref:DUF1120 domain-containing protein n=1 Tax=Achromobacter spanius TaxID=217203 RepID=UPI0038114C28
MTVTTNLLTAAAITAVLSTASGAYAQSIDVRVTGSITPAACVPTIGGGGVIDFGVIPAASLNQTTTTALPKKTVPLSIACNAPTQVAITATDNRRDSVLSTNMWEFKYGLGTAAGVNIGEFMMFVDPGSVTVEGLPAFSIDSGNGATWYDTTVGIVTQRGLTSWSLSKGGAPVAFKNLVGSLSVNAVINKGENLTLKEEIQLDGLATLELVYL